VISIHTPILLSAFATTTPAAFAALQICFAATAAVFVTCAVHRIAERRVFSLHGRPGVSHWLSALSGWKRSP
jgi:hypothetical protein